MSKDTNSSRKSKLGGVLSQKRASLSQDRSSKSYYVKKGKIGEREIAEKFTKWTGVRYRRTPNSGGLRLDFPFDIMKVEKKPSIFDYVGIEVKNHKTLRIPDWIEQIKGECIDAGISNKWLLAFKNKGEWFYLLNENFLEKLLNANLNQRSE